MANDAKDPQQGFPFVTDDVIALRLKRAEEGLLHIEDSAGAIKRDLEALRLLIEPPLAA